MELYLRSGLYAATWGRDLIFFDAHAGRYQLMAGVAESVEAAIGSRLLVNDDVFAEFLHAEGLVGPQLAVQSDLHIPPPKPIRSALNYPTSTANRHLVDVLREYASMTVLYPGRSIRFLLEHARVQPARQRATSAVDVAQALNHFLPYFPLQGTCVFRSFLMMRLLSQAGAGQPRWVFGVRTWPFYAHCWVQDHEVAFTDYPETLARFTPIFAA